jgi:glycosyltransferase involved in cell wall biosynthesis
LGAAAIRRGAAVPENILFVGRLVPHKAVDEVIRVFALVQRATGGKCRLTIVGAGGEAENYSARVRAYATSVARDSVDFLGVRHGQSLADAFERAGVYLSMSRHEGFGLPLCEAMFAGVPVVAADHGATRETVGDGGLVIADADLAVVAEATQAMLYDPALRGKILEAQKLRKTFFTEDALAKRLQEALDFVLAAA